MRRVVVTGLGMVTPLGCGVDVTWARILNGQSGARRIETFEVADLSCRIACVVRAATAARHVQSGRVDGAEGPAQGRRLHHLCDGRRAPGARRRQLASRDRRRQMRDRDLIGSGIGGLSASPTRAAVERTRAAQGIAVLHSRRLINLASGYVSIEHGLKGPIIPSSPHVRRARMRSATPAA